MAPEIGSSRRRRFLILTIQFVLAILASVIPASIFPQFVTWIILGLWTCVGLVFSWRFFALGARRASRVSMAWAVLCAGFLVLEAGLALRAAPLFRETWSHAVVEPDAMLGTRPKPNVMARHVRRFRPTDDKRNWDVVYTVEADGSRRVPNRPDQGPRLSLFGGSFVFGEGLDDQETIPAHLQTLTPRYRVFNHAVRGHGTAQNYFLMRRVLNADVPDQICVVGFIADHIQRTTMPARLIASDWARDHPRVVVRDGGIVNLGPAYAALPWESKLHVGLLRHSRVYRRIASRRARENVDWTLLSELVLAMRNCCVSEGKGARFAFVILPTGIGAASRLLETAEFHAWKNQLRAHGVVVIDLIADFENWVERSGKPRASFFFPDGHPGVDYTRWVAERIAAWVG